MEEDSLPKFQVIKRIDFCYGHRLLNYDGKCRHLHGHNAKVEICLASETLDARGMAYDFVEIKRRLKQWIDETLDYKMILNEADPAVPLLQEQKEPLYLMKENPTAENIAKLIYQQAQQCGFNVEAVKVWETPDSCAIYHG